MNSRNKASNRQIKKWRKLQQGKYRQKEGLFLAEGERCVSQILGNRALVVKELVVDENFEITERISSSGLGIYSVSTAELDEITDTENPQGILAVCRIPEERELVDLARKSGILIATDEIQDPGNLGTILRTAVWFGAAGLLAGKGSVDPWHPKVVRSTAGATGVLPIIKGDLRNMLKSLSDEGWEILLLDKGRESENLREVKKFEKAVITVGNEAKGICEDLLGEGWKTVKIGGEMDGVESLNAAIATGIALYHFCR
ncbi:MAG: RNA methyltransferase [Balneolaceae bacterium]